MSKRFEKPHPKRGHLGTGEQQKHAGCHWGARGGDQHHEEALLHLGAPKDHRQVRKEPTECAAAGGHAALTTPEKGLPVSPRSNRLLPRQPYPENTRRKPRVCPQKASKMTPAALFVIVKTRND